MPDEEDPFAGFTHGTNVSELLSVSELASGLDSVSELASGLIAQRSDSAAV
jgi:hypothetical protein